VTLTVEQLNVLLLARAGALYPATAQIRRVSMDGNGKLQRLPYGNHRVIWCMRRDGLIGADDRLTEAGHAALRSGS
jgi:hypothetical protein